MKIPEGWQIKKLKDCFFIDRDSLGNKTPPNYSFQYISLSDVDRGKILQYQKMKFINAPLRARRKVKVGDVLLGTVRPNLQPFAYIKNEANIIASTGFAVLTPKNGAPYLFQYLFSEHANNQFYSFVVGSNYPALNSSDVKTFKILLPPLPEQKKIAKILSCWDESIEKIEKLVTAKKTFKKGVMQKLMTGKLQSLHWKTIPLKYVFNERKEYSPLSSKIPLYSLTIEDGVTSKTERYEREFLVKNSEKKYKKVYPKDVVFNPANLRWGAIAESFEDKIVKISPVYEVLSYKNKDKYFPDFIRQTVCSDRQIKIFATKVEGTLIERMAVKIGVFLNTKINIPSLDEQRRIAETLSVIDKEIEFLERKRDLLKKQKKGLMQKLLTGKIRVKV